jgi:hypothetical protein
VDTHYRKAIRQHASLIDGERTRALTGCWRSGFFGPGAKRVKHPMKEERKRAGLPVRVSVYRAVLAVKDEGEDTLAAWRRSSILDCCARRDVPEAGNPAQDHFGDLRS